MRICFLQRASRSVSVMLLVVAALTAASAGCKGKPEPVAAQSKRFRPADEADKRDVTPAAHASEAATAQAATSAAEVKAADAKMDNPVLQATLEQLDRLALEQPKGTTEREQLEELVRIHSQRLALAKKALAMNPPADVKPRIVMAMFEIHQVFVQLGVPNAMQQLTDFAKTISADPDQEIARIGRHASFTAHLSRIVTQPLENGKEIVSEAKKLLEAEAGAINDDTEQVVVQTARVLMQLGHSSDAADLIDSLAKALEATPGQAERAKQYAAHAQIARADLTKMLYEVLSGEAGAAEKLVSQVKELLKSAPPGPDLLQKTYDVAHNLEAAGQYAAAQQCFDAMNEAFKDATPPELANAKELAEKARQRMALIGQPLKIEGVLADGRPFDWTPYEGKVVLIDFWASWCEPCLAEIPNIRQNFEQFHAKGFEVVGVNLNTNPGDLKQFLTLQDLPWATVTTQDMLDGKVGKEDWTKMPMAEKCGVNSIPFVVLIGKDGKVDSIHVRGNKLKNRLVALLGEPITTEVPADPTQPERPATSANPGAGNIR